LSRSIPTQRGRDVVSGAAEALEYLFVGNGTAVLDVGAGQGHALRIRRTRTERANTKYRNPKSEFSHRNSSLYICRDRSGFPGVGKSHSNFCDYLEAKAQCDQRRTKGGVGFQCRLTWTVYRSSLVEKISPGSLQLLRRHYLSARGVRRFCLVTLLLASTGDTRSHGEVSPSNRIPPRAAQRSVRPFPAGLHRLLIPLA